MKSDEGLPLIKIMMLLSSMAPLFLLVAIRGMESLLDDKHLWIVTGILIVIPYLIIRLRIYLAKKSNDCYVIDVSNAKNNKEYLFTFLFTVLLPLYSVSIEDKRDFYAILTAIAIIIFILWNLNLHFINILFAIQGYRVYTLENDTTFILITKRHSFSKELTSIKVYRLSNTVLMEIENK